MNYSDKILWGEGLFLRPQHFQRQDAYHESRLHETAVALHPYSWGVRHVRVDPDALANGSLRLIELSALLPDGEIYGAPHADTLPPALALEGFASGCTEMIFHLALAPMRINGLNCTADSTAGLNVRFTQEQANAEDWYTDSESAQLALLKKSVRLLADSEPRDAYMTLPLLRVRRTAIGGFEIDETFVPPCISLRASEYLVLQLRRLLDILQAKVSALYGFHREPNKSVIEFRSGDVASFWLLHTTSSAFAALSHLLQHPALHPERLFQQLLQLAGALMTFSKTFVLSDLPIYKHGDPGPAFARLDSLIRDLLETVISTRYFAIALTETKPSYWLARLESGKIDENTLFYLSITADVAAIELVELVPQRLKVGGPDDVEKLVLSAMPGV